MYKDRAWLRSRAQAAIPAPPSSWPSGIRALPWRVLIVISAGGVLGALARQGIWAAFPRHPGAFDWATLAINVAGCALIGALMTVIAEVRPVHRLIPPFLGSGVLGGFTTFSTYIVGIQQSIDAGASGIAAAYLAGTLAAAVAAVYAGRTGARQVLRRLLADRGSGPLPAMDNGEQLPETAPRALQDLEGR